MNTDRELQERILSALEFEPGVDAAQVGVSVRHGVAALQGSVTTLSQKWMAERAAQRVYGVRAVANDITVRPDHATSRTDPAIAEAVANALAWNASVPVNAVQAAVRDGWVTLTGIVPWPFQRTAAERTVRHLYGVRGVSNAIMLKPPVSTTDIKAKIENAFKRSAEVDAEHVQVESHDGEVILTGTVRSMAERREAERAAWAAQGVTRVDDRLVVNP